MAAAVGGTGNCRRKRLSVKFIEVARVDDAGLRTLLGLDGKSPGAAQKQAWRFRSRHGIRRMPGGFYDLGAVRSAIAADAGA